MAAYGALVSVMQIMDQLHHHPRPPISIRKQHVESLTTNVTFLQEFLERYNPRRSYTSEADPLESRIAKAAYAAEDVIESYIVDQIHAQSSDQVEDISSTQFYQGLEKVIEEMDLIKIEAKKKMKEDKNMGVQIIKKSLTNAASFRSSPSNAQKVGMVGFDDVLYQMLDKLTGGERARQIIPIVGMGGLGKTTLARNIYAHPLIKEHFHICAWSTVSQVHNARKILSEILDQVEGEKGGDLSEHELGLKLYQHLIGRRYLIVMDDMWSIEAWDVVRSFFPESENGSRVVVTTRLSNLASMFDYSDVLNMKFLDEASSWNLFSKTVFGEEIYPPELEDIGKKIVEGCGGLPLSIVVVGGLLSKSEATRENWELIEENLSSVVNSEDDGSCLQILYTSYNNLPVHLKPCFLYMGAFPEDYEFMVILLVTQWVAEGFIKSFDGKILEEAAEDYIQELVDRNLILVQERGDSGKVESLKMHDLLRDLALREGEKDKFLYVLKDESGDDRKISPGTISTQRRIATSFKEDPSIQLLESLEPASSSVVRSLIGKFPATFSISNFRLLRVCMDLDSDSDKEESRVCMDSDSDSDEDENSNEFIRLANLRHISVHVEKHPVPRIPSWASSFWNLQTLWIICEWEEYVLDIWKMPLLRHVIIDTKTTFRLRKPPVSGDDMDEVVLQNLKTLAVVSNLILSENVVKRIPYINTLSLKYGETSTRGKGLGNDFCLNNLGRLHQLQVLLLYTSYLNVHQHTLTFPHSLKELTLVGTRLHWEEMETKIGCLPLLHVLRLEKNSFIGSQWETVEGQFPSLKFLKIEDCRLEYWITDSTHFPSLEHLFLHHVTKLREIPSSIGDIPTLRSIELLGCRISANKSAQRIAEEQEEYGNELLQIEVDWESI